MKLFKGLAFSILIHGLFFLAGLGYLSWQKARAGQALDIDLQSSSLLLRPRQLMPGTRPAAIPLEPWVLTAGKRIAALLPKIPRPLPTEVPDLPAAPENSAGSNIPGPAAGPVWVPASQAAHCPELLDTLITEDDYPPTARKQGKEGRVVALVLIDAAGNVSEVQIAEGSYPEFNQLVLERLRQAKFRPGRDQNHQPIGVRMSIPVMFELQ